MDQPEGETKQPPDEDGDFNFETSGSESENLEEAKPNKKRKKTKAKKTKAAAGDGNDYASSSEVMTVTSHDEYLAKKRRDADDLEADKHTRAANMKADAARSRAISKSAKPLLHLFMRLGVDKMADCRMINVEAFYNQDCLVELDDKRIESICHVNRRREDYATTYISSSGEYNLKLAVFYMKHLKNTGHYYDPFFINRKDVLLFRAHKMSVESPKRSNIDAPIFTNRMMEKEPDHVWELLDEYLCAMRDNSGIPLAVWNRARNKLFPKGAADDNVSNCVTQDA